MRRSRQWWIKFSERNRRGFHNVETGPSTRIWWYYVPLNTINPKVSSSLQIQLLFYIFKQRWCWLVQVEYCLILKGICQTQIVGTRKGSRNVVVLFSVLYFEGIVLSPLFKAERSARGWRCPRLTDPDPSRRCRVPTPRNIPGPQSPGWNATLTVDESCRLLTFVAGR